MSDRGYQTSPITPLDQRQVQNVRGVLGSRVFAWLGDVVAVFFLGCLISAALVVMGVFTFGATWLLIPIAAVATAFAYAALTIGGPKQATWGMRMAGLKVETVTGGRPDGLTAAVHALLFYVAAGTVGLWVLDLAFGLLRSDRRLGHDLLTGLVVVRR